MTKLRMMRIIAVSCLNSFLFRRQKQEVFFVENDIDTKEITTAKFIEIMKNNIIENSFKLFLTLSSREVQMVPFFSFLQHIRYKKLYNLTKIYCCNVLFHLYR